MKILLVIKSYWMKFARAIGWLNTRVLLTLVYFLVFGPVALVARLVKGDLLNRRWDDRKSYWVKKEETVDSLERHLHQF